MIYGSLNAKRKGMINSTGPWECRGLEVVVENFQHLPTGYYHFIFNWKDKQTNTHMHNIYVSFMF